MVYRIVRTAAEIDALLDACAEAEAEGTSKYPGMTYEQGIAAGLGWLTDEEQTDPLE